MITRGMEILRLSLIVLFCVTAAAIASSDPNISILWEQEIAQAGRAIMPYAIKVSGDKNTIRVIGVSYIARTKESPKTKDPQLFEYQIVLKDNKSTMKTLLPMNEEDIAVTLPQQIKDSRLINDNIVLIRGQYKSFNFQELTIGTDWQVNSRDISGLTRSSVSTHGACRNLNGDVYLCGNSGYIRKVKSDGSVAWDTNYKSDKEEDGTLGVAFSESDKTLVAFGFSFTPDTKFTTKNSNLWLANLDSDGNFKAKTEFEGIVDLGKNPSFCLGTSDNPTVIYDNSPELKRCEILVSKFSKDLNTKVWTTPVFEEKDAMAISMSLTPFGQDNTLATFISMIGQNIRPHFYILNKNGSIVNRAIFEEPKSTVFLVTVLEDRIFLVADGRRYENNKVTDFARLICFKINP